MYSVVCLVSTIIFGQAIGFAGAFVGGLEAKKRAKEITRLNKSLLEVNGKIKKELRREKQSKTPGVDMSIDSDGDPYVEKILTLKLARCLISLIRMVFILGEPCWLR